MNRNSMPAVAATYKYNAADWALTGGVACATFWDFRLFDFRIFDALALVLLGIWLILAPEPRAGFLQRRRDYWILFLTVVIYAVVGFALQGHRSSLAIIALATLGFVLAGRSEWLRIVGPRLWTLVGVHIAFFLIQFAGYYVFGWIIDYQNLTGDTARIMVAADHMRAAGLFQEANSYCLNLFMLTSIAILWRPHRLLTFAAALTVVLSESLWGLGAAMLLLLINESRYRHSLRQRLTAIFSSTVIIAALFNGFLWLNSTTDFGMPHLYYRIETIVNDPSLRERYLRNGCPEAVASRANAQNGLVPFLLGQGLSTGYFKACLPANGISLLLKSFGAAGLLALLAGTAVALRGLPNGAKLYAIVAVGFSFTSYPLMTYLIFWLWIPAMFGLLRLRAPEPKPAAEPLPPSH